MGSAACVGQLLAAPPGLPPPGLPLLGSTRKQHPLISSSHSRLQGRSTAEGAKADAEVSSNCSTTDSLPQDVPASTRVLRQLGSDIGATATVSEPCRVLSLHSAVPEPAPLGSQERPTLSLHSAVPEPAPLGSQERPTVGSICHHLGICKPCAHAFSKEGCHNGAMCNFCHLCGPEEIKRRKKEKRASQRALNRCPPAHA